MTTYLAAFAAQNRQSSLEYHLDFGSESRVLLDVHHAVLKPHYLHLQPRGSRVVGGGDLIPGVRDGRGADHNQQVAANVRAI